MRHVRSISAIQSDLDAAYAARTRILKGGAQSVGQPTHNVTFLTLAQCDEAISSLQGELASARAEACGDRGGAGGWGVNRLIKG